MAYDEKLATRIREILAGRKGVTEKKMFGGLGFMVDDKMVAGIMGEDLMLRVGPERHEEALAKKHVRVMDFAGRPMKGFVYVEPKGYATKAELAGWIKWSSDYAATVTKKPKKAKGKTSPRK